MPTDIKEKRYNCNDPQLDEIHQALIKEYEAVSRKQNEQKIILYNGLLQQSLPNKFLYKFETPNDPDKKIEPDKPHTLSIDGIAVDGTIFSINENYIEIELKESHGKLIPSINIIIDLRILLDLIDRRIVLIDKEPNKFKVHTSKYLFNPVIIEDSPLHSFLNHTERPDLENGLNDEQIRAINNALSKKLTIIWGPPGTGKTITLQGVIAELLSNGKKVLFASNTNNAIDGLLKGFISKSLCPYSYLNELREKGKIVRIGSQTNEDVKNVFSPKAVVEKKSENIILKIKELEKILEVEQNKYNVIISEINDYKNAKELKAELEKLNTRLYEIPKPSSFTEKIENLHRQKESLFSLFSKKISDVFTSVSELSQLNSNISAEKEKLVGTNAQIFKTESDLKQVKVKIDELAEERNRITVSVFKRVFNKEKLDSIDKQLTKLKESYTGKNLQLNQYKNQQKILTDNVTYLTGKFVNLFNSLNNQVDSLSIDYPKLESLLAYFNFRINVNYSGSLWLSSAVELGLCSKEKAYHISYLRGFSTIKKETILEKYNKRLSNLEGQIRNSEILKSRIEEDLVKIKYEFSKISHLLNKPSVYWIELNEKTDRIQSEKILPLKEQIRLLNNELKEIEKTVIEDADLICATLVKTSYDEILLKLSFDVLVADEISMVSLPQLFCASSLISERIVLSGDPLQLQPIAISKSEIAKKWLKRSYFQLIDYKPFASNLSTQFRMPTEVSDLVKDWYKKEGNILKDGKLSTSSPINFTEHFLNKGNLFLIDTSSLNSYHSRSSDRSPYNLINAAIVAEITRELIEEYNINQKEIFCISAYRAQYQLTWALLKKFINPAFKLRNEISSSVHKVQGSEASIVFYDLTDGRQSGFTYFLKTPELFIHNVAITRSKNKLIFVGDLEKLKKLDTLDEPKPSFLDILIKLRKSAIIINAKAYKEKIFKTYSFEDLIGDSTINLSSEKKNNIVILTSATYYKALREDILRASKSILIISPFITRNRWEKVKPLLINFKKNNPNGNIKIISKPPDQMYQAEQINMAAVKILNEFLDLGFEVKVSKKIHSKLVVLDQGTKNAISYWGSLNPLSFNNTDEINSRLDGAEIAEKLLNLSMVGNLKNYSKITFQQNQYKAHTRASVLKQLKDFRWTLAGYYHRFMGSICSNSTLESIIELLPKTREEYSQIAEFNRTNFLLWNHLDEINEIISPLRIFENRKSGQSSLF